MGSALRSPRKEVLNSKASLAPQGENGNSNTGNISCTDTTPSEMKQVKNAKLRESTQTLSNYHHIQTAQLGLGEQWREMGGVYKDRGPNSAE